MNSPLTKNRGVARLLLGLVALTLALPGAAVANHTGGTGGGTTCSEALRNCVGFSPAMDVGVAFPYVDTPSTIVFQAGQADHELPVIQADYYLPKGWQFPVEKVRPAKKASAPGTDAEMCDDIYSGSAPKVVQTAEILAYGLGSWYKHGSSRTSVQYGFIPGKNDDPRKPSLSFLNWNATKQKATLCWYLFNSSAPGATADEITLTVDLVKLPASDPNGWRISIDWRSFVKNAELYNAEASQIVSYFFFYGKSAGNWHLNSLGQKESILFHKTPSTPGNYTITSVFTGCANGAADPSVAPVPENGCKGATTSDPKTTTVTNSELIQITPAPDAGTYDFGRFTAPPTSTGLRNIGSTPQYYSLSWGNSTYPVTWSQPPVSPGRSIVAYELQVKKAGDSTDTYYQRIPTAGACGDDGTSPACSYTLAFPMNAGSSVFTTDGHYQLRLVTIYSDTQRTDGKCDDGNHGGTLCDPNRPAPTIPHAGYAEKFLLMRSRAWPDAFWSGTANSPTKIAGYPYQHVLFVDFGAQTVELIKWWPYAVEESRVFHDNGIKQYDNNNATVWFGDAQIGGKNRRFQYFGRMVNNPNSISGHWMEYEPRGCDITTNINHICQGDPTTVRSKNDDVTFTRIT